MHKIGLQYISLLSLYVLELLRNWSTLGVSAPRVAVVVILCLKFCVHICDGSVCMSGK